MIQDNAFRIIDLVMGTSLFISSSLSPLSNNDHCRFCYQNQFAALPLRHFFVPPGGSCVYTTRRQQRRRQMENEDRVLVPPVNFGCVEMGVFRSAEPTRDNFSFLNKIQLKNIVWLSPEEPSDDFQAYAQDHNIQIHSICTTSSSPSPSAISTPHSLPTTIFSTSSSLLSATTTPTTTNTTNNNLNSTSTTATTSNNITNITLTSNPLAPSNINQALTFIVDKSHHPVLICSRNGRYRTGAVIACLRRLQCWNLQSTLAEYRRFIGVKPEADGAAVVVGNEGLIVGFERGNVEVPGVGDERRAGFLFVFPGMG